MSKWFRGLVFLGWLPIAGKAAAQARPAGPPPPHAVWNRTTTGKWAASGQPDSLSKSPVQSGSIRVDSVQITNAGTRYFVSELRSTAQFTISPNGEMSGFTAGYYPAPRVYLLPDDSVRTDRFGYLESTIDYTPLLPTFRFADVATSLPSAHARSGEHWIERIDRAGSHNDISQSLSGTRSQLVLRDTVIGGRHAWIVRDSAHVKYTDGLDQDDSYKGKPIHLTRDVSGTIKGLVVYDDESHLVLSRNDTTRLNGTVTQTYPDGRKIAAPLRLVRARAYTFLDSAAVVAARAATRPRPGISTEQLQAMSSSRQKRAADYLASQDTAGAFTELSRGFRQLDTTDVSLILAAFHDPALTLRYGVRMDFLLGDAYNRLLRAIPAITADTAKWGCAPKACAMLIRLLGPRNDNTQDVRLRDFAIAAGVVTDPARWAPVAQTELATDEYFSDVRDLIRGVATTWPAGSHKPIPGPGADWTAWEQWMNGLNPEYHQQRLGNRDTLNRAHPGVRFDDRHRTVLQFQRAMNGRDFVKEFQSALVSASDSAKLVYRTMLIGLNAYTGTSRDVATRLLHGSDVEQQSATREAVALLRTAAPASPALSDSLRDDLLHILFDGDTTLFRPLKTTARGYLGRQRVPAGDSIFIVLEKSSPALQERWASRGKIVTDSSWQPPYDRFPSAVYSVSEARVSGDFAMISYDFSYRRPDSRIAPGPGAMSTGGTVYLVRTETGWRVFAGDTFIT